MFTLTELLSSHTGSKSIFFLSPPLFIPTVSLNRLVKNKICKGGGPQSETTLAHFSLYFSPSPFTFKSPIFSPPSDSLPPILLLFFFTLTFTSGATLMLAKSGFSTILDQKSLIFFSPRKTFT